MRPEVALLASILPGAASRAALQADQHRLPITYFGSLIETPSDWIKRPAAYLAFGDTYDSERAQAKRWGWPVETLDGRHLHPLVAPQSVARALDRLLRRQLDGR
jgi:hypothetical protein